ncbi:heparinase II/III-family protein [Aquamicrobium segne]|uniref:Heparinase II/III-family protein n=1 Tax=Aquamicrobium segne TaxID=469547 RepID=A0ABW0GW39_9HYPH
MRRLAVMERGEIRHRIHEQWKKRAVRRETSGWAPFAMPAQRPVSLPLFAPLLADNLAPAISAQLERAAQKFQSGKPTLLNCDWPTEILDQKGCIAPHIWTLDPVSLTHWPGKEVSAFDIDFRFGANKRDIKYVAELNRLHFLVAPAIQARRTENKILTKAILGSILSWMEANPPGRGVNWYSGIESGYRLVSVAAIVSVLDPWIDGQTAKNLAAFIAAHATWLARFPSLFSSANNHLVAEAMGLVLAARLLPDHQQAKNWLENGKIYLEDRTLALFHEDGIGQEQSPAYAAFTLEMLLIGFGVLDQDAICPAIKQRLTKAASALKAFLDDEGTVPLIGDDDQSRVLMAYGSNEPRYAASIVAALAGFLNRPDLAPSRYDAHWRDIVFASPPPGPFLKDGTTSFLQGGYTIRRGTIAGRRIHLTFDHGPLGFGALAAHGHADALSVWLSLDGKPVLVDAGTYAYHSEGENRRRFRVTDVHNTLTLAGASQSEPSGPFNWKPNRAQAKLEKGANTAPLDLSAWHDGYEKRFGVIHHRALVETTTGFDIIDRLTGKTPESEVEIAFLLAPDLEASIEHDAVRVTRAGQPEMMIMAPKGAAIKIIQGDAASGRGFHSPGFGILQQATTIVFQTNANRENWKSSIVLGP